MLTPMMFEYKAILLKSFSISILLAFDGKVNHISNITELTLIYKPIKTPLMEGIPGITQNSNIKYNLRFVLTLVQFVHES